MVRQHVPQRAGRIVELAAMLDRERLRDSDLDMIDVIAVPDRLEQAVGKPQRQNVLHRLLSEIMIDAVDLVLIEQLEQLMIERARGSKIGAERLLDDDAPPGTVALACKARLREPDADGRKGGGRRRKIK